MEQETVARYCGVHILDNPFSIDGAFHYYVPPYMAAAVTRGAFVTVPFGRGNRKQLAVVVDTGDASILPPSSPPIRSSPSTESAAKSCSCLPASWDCASTSRRPPSAPWARPSAPWFPPPLWPL